MSVLRRYHVGIASVPGRWIRGVNVAFGVLWTVAKNDQLLRLVSVRLRYVRAVIIFEIKKLTIQVDPMIRLG